MRTLITGCGGFVGKHICRMLKEQGEDSREIFAGVLNEQEARAVREQIQLPEGQVLQADITDAAAVEDMVKKALPRRVIHLAAQASVALSFQKPELTMKVNVEGTKNLLAALRRISPGARILIVGSIDQYGDVPAKEQPVSETRPLTGASPYGESKRRQEQLALQCVKEYGQDIILVRSAPHIGRGQSRQFAAADWTAQIREMKAGKRPHVLTVGNLKAVRDITDVRDIARAYLLLLEMGETGQVYNAGTGKGRSMGEIPSLLGKLAGIGDLKIVSDPARLRPSDIPMLVPDVSRLKSRTGWQPVYSLEDTLLWMLGMTE